MWLSYVKLSALAVALALAAVGPGAAQQQEEPSASHLAAARELILLNGASVAVERIMPALVANVRRQAVTRPELTKDLEEVLKAMEPELEQQRQQALLVTARAYAKWLNEEEIKDAIAFFRSPSGAKYARLLPDITEEYVNSVSAWTQLASEYVMTRARAEMLKRGHQIQ